MTIDISPARLQFQAPFTPIAWTPGGTAIYPAQGGRGGGGITFAVGDDNGSDPEFDDEQDDEQDDEDDEQDDDDDDEPAAHQRTSRRGQQADDEGDDDWQPPTREAWERVTGSLKRANSEAGKRRRVGKMMDKLGIDDLSTWLTARGIDPETGAPFGNDVVDPDDGDGLDDGDEFGYEQEGTTRRRADDDRARDRQTARQLLTAEQRGRAAARDEMMPILGEYAARSALRDAGFIGNPRQLERALRSIDPGSLELDLTDDGFELVGIDEAIAELQDDFPDLFEKSRQQTRRTATKATSRTRGGAREVDGGERGRQPAKPRSWKEQIAEQMAKGRR